MAALQIALSLALLTGSALLVRTAHNFYAIDPGFAADNTFVVTLDLLDELSDEQREPEALRALFDELRAAVGAVSGVDAAAVNGWFAPFQTPIPGRIERLDAPGSDVARADLRWISPGWLELMKIPALSGRTLRASDAGSSPPRIVVTTHMAQRLFGREDVTGRTVRVRPPWLQSFSDAEIVGVVGDVRLSDLTERSETGALVGPASPDDAVFLPLDARFTRFERGSVTLLARSGAASAGVAEAIRRAVQGVVPHLAVPRPTPVTERIERELGERRIYLRLLGLLSTFAAILAAVGLYGVVSFAVAGRRRELGIRMALGADGLDITGLVARTAAAIVVSGTVLGLAAAYALTGAIESLLFGVRAVDTISYLGAAGLLAVVAAAACWLPVRAALAVQPSETLREA